MIIFRPEASLIYVNAEAVSEAVLSRVHEPASGPIHLVVCDLSASPYLDLAGSRMLRELEAELSSRNVALRIVGAHGTARDLLHADGIEERVLGFDRAATLEEALRTAPP